MAFQLGVTNRFVDPNFPPCTNVLEGPYEYTLVAHYAQGDSATATSPYLPVGAFSVFTVAGPLGTTLMRVTHAPPGASSLRLTRIDQDYWQGPYELMVTNFDFALGLFTNGFFTLPQAWTVSGPYGAEYYAQAVWPDGSVGQAVSAGYPAPAFYDGRLQLAQNLAFVLRAATVTGPLHFSSFSFPGNYAFANPISDLNGSCVGGYYGSDYTRPFADNWFYRNFVFATTNLEASAGVLATGITWDDVNGDVIPTSPEYVFQMPTNGVFPGFLSAADTPWIMPHSDPTLLNLYTTATLFTVQNNVSNWYGLRLLSAEFTSAGPSYMTRSPGQSAGRTNSFFYANFDPPSLSTASYLFGGYNYDGSYSTQGPWPGDSAFSPTNPQPLLVASLGNSYQAVAYARQTINNGDHGKPAYLGQYFESAFAVDTNGVVTTNQAGVLSSYGDYFPTQPGAAALVTMTNWGVNERGTGIVHVVALATDVNRDGVIDPSLFGPDYTSPDYPFRFWVNDCNDSGDDQGSGIPGQGDGGTGLFLYQSSGSVSGTRALVNFFPVQVCIQSLLKAVPSLSTLTFKLRHDESALYYLETDLTPDHSYDYLTSTNFLGSLPSYMGSAGRVWSTGVPLSTNFLAKIRDQGKGVILVEAGQATGSPLVLEVWQGNSLLAQASLYVSIYGVENMFRQKNLIRETFPSPTEFPGLPDRLTTGSGERESGTAWNEPETNDKNFVFVHGYNVSPDQARGNAADMFKRLYWSGSHAKFYGVTWNGAETQPLAYGLFTPDYHTNVVNAFLTASNLASFLGTLTNGPTNGPTTVAAHSLGNMVVLSAINDWNAPISNYFMIDAAVALEAIQTNAAQDVNMIHSEWVPYANRLYSHDWHGLFAAGDERSALTWTNRLANFRNVEVYNFFSSGEEVLRECTTDPPTTVLGGIWTEVYGYFAQQIPFGCYGWAWQEKAKGRSANDLFVGSTHGGWQFNYWSDAFYVTNGEGIRSFMGPDQTSGLTSSQLQTNSFFNFNSTYHPHPDAALLGANGSMYAQTNRNRILADAIPALTLPVGANPVARLETLGRDINMQDLANGWPLLRSVGAEAFKWHHSDFRQLGYTFTYQLFDELVTLGDLK